MGSAGHGHVDSLSALQGQRLEVFRAHNRARTATPCLASTVVGDAGVTDQILPRRADAGDAGLPAQPFFHGLLGVESTQAHQAGGVQELGDAVFNEQ